MINGAKFSANGSSLYGFRRAISRSLYKNGIEYDLMGVNWKMNKFKEARERLWAFRKEVIARNTPSFKEAFSDFFTSTQNIEEKFPTRFLLLASINTLW